MIQIQLLSTLEVFQIREFVLFVVIFALGAELSYHLDSAIFSNLQDITHYSRKNPEEDEVMVNSL